MLPRLPGKLGQRRDLLIPHVTQTVVSLPSSFTSFISEREGFGAFTSHFVRVPVGGSALLTIMSLSNDHPPRPTCPSGKSRRARPDQQSPTMPLHGWYHFESGLLFEFLPLRQSRRPCYLVAKSQGRLDWRCSCDEVRSFYRQTPLLNF